MTLRQILLLLLSKQQSNRGTYYLVLGPQEFTASALLKQSTPILERPAFLGAWYVDVTGFGRFAVQWVSPALPRVA